MKNLLLFLLLLLGGAKTNAQVMEQWYSDINTLPVSYDYYGSSTDKFGNTYVGGFGGDSFVLYKVNNLGLVEWMRNDIQLKYVISLYSSIKAVDDGVLLISSQDNFTKTGVVKLDTWGNTVWNHVIPELAENDYTEKMDIDKNGNIVLAEMLTAGLYDTLKVVSFDNTGQQKWLRTLVSPYSAGGGYTLYTAFDNAGNYYVSSNFRSGLANPIYYTFIYKIDTTGQVLWNYEYPNSNSYGFSMDVDSAQNVFAALTNTAKLFRLDSSGSLISSSNVASISNVAWLKRKANGNLLIISGANAGAESAPVPVKINEITVGGQPVHSYVDNTPYKIVRGFNLDEQTQNLVTYGYNGDSANSPYVISLDFEIFDKNLNQLQHVARPSIGSYYDPSPYMGVDGSGNIYTSGSFNVLDSVSSKHGYYVLKLCATCEPTIAGLAYNDTAQPCVVNSTETKFHNRLVELTPGPYYAYTYTNGEYGFIKSSGDYTLKQMLPQYWMGTCADSIHVHLDSASQVSYNNDFGSYAIPNVHDKLISIATGAARPGFQQAGRMNYSNVGTVDESGTIVLQVDSAFVLNSSYPLYDSVSGNSYFWNYSNLLIGEERQIDFVVDIPVNTPLAYTFHYACRIESIANDTTSHNNVDTATWFVTSSLDPNEKLVTVKNADEQGNLTDSSTLVYQINFQNTGNDTAFKIVVIDTLDVNVDVSSLQVLVASHDYVLDFIGQRILRWTFSNVLLPDVTTNELRSHGFIKYSIKPKKNLPMGTAISNTANIYFDFNPCVRTNIVSNYFESILSVSEIESTTKQGLKVIPNPFNAEARVILSSPTGQATELLLYGILGNVVHRELFNDDANLMIEGNNLAKGLYFVEVRQKGKAIALSKVILQ